MVLSEDIYEQEERPHHVPIANATWKPIPKHGWYCEKCSMYMKLLPINKDIPASHWECRCRGISLLQRDKSFQINKEITQDLYLLRKLNYDKQNIHWDIESAQWSSPDESRINSQRRIIRDMDLIISELKALIEEELEISFENFQDFFNE